MQWLVAYLTDRLDAVTPRLTRLGHFTAHGAPFPGYLFFNYNHRWTDVRDIDGVGRILGRKTEDGVDPHVIPQHVLDSIANRDERGDEKQAQQPLPRGAVVHIKAGSNKELFAHQALVGRISEDEKHKNPRHGRSPVMLDFLSGPVLHWIPTHLLELA